MKQILLIDDVKAIAQIVQIYLHDQYKVQWMDNAPQAITWLRAGNRPDLILTDIRMPEMRGDELLQQLKEDAALASIPVAILSGEESTSERSRLLQNGAIDYIVKPFNPTELANRIKKIIEHNTSTRISEPQ